MLIRGNNTARQAAEIFLSECYGDRRIWKIVARPLGGFRFRLVGGTRWYSLVMVKEGWEINEE